MASRKAYADVKQLAEAQMQHIVEELESRASSLTQAKLRQQEEELRQQLTHALEQDRETFLQADLAHAQQRDAAMDALVRSVQVSQEKLLQMERIAKELKKQHQLAAAVASLSETTRLHKPLSDDINRLYVVAKDDVLIQGILDTLPERTYIAGVPSLYFIQRDFASMKDQLKVASIAPENPSVMQKAMATVRAGLTFEGVSHEEVFGKLQEVWFGFEFCVCGV